MKNKNYKKKIILDESILEKQKNIKIAEKLQKNDREGFSGVFYIRNKLGTMINLFYDSIKFEKFKWS